jgi:hypothetical protein
LQPSAFRCPPHFVKQHSLADAAKADQDGALRVPSHPDPIERYGDIFENIFAASELGRPRSGTGCERVATRVHMRDLPSSTSFV